MKNVAHCLFSYYFTFERPYLQAVFVLHACLLLNLSSPLLYLFIYLSTCVLTLSVWVIFAHISCIEHTAHVSGRRACLRVFTPARYSRAAQPRRHTHGRHMSGQDRECRGRRPVSGDHCDHWLKGSANGARRRRHGSQWSARRAWARGFAHMLTLVNCREKEAAQAQTDERQAGWCVCICVCDREVMLGVPMLLQPRSVDWRTKSRRQSHPPLLLKSAVIFKSALLKVRIFKSIFFFFVCRSWQLSLKEFPVLCVPSRYNFNIS